jgi:hypothetical protein
MEDVGRDMPAPLAMPLIDRGLADARLTGGDLGEGVGGHDRWRRQAAIAVGDEAVHHQMRWRARR